MKLKLEIQEGTTILFVAEGISLQNVAVLKAGVNKILQSGKKTILLDLTSLEEPDLESPDVKRELAEIPSSITDVEAHLVIASPIAGLGHAMTRDEGLKALNSPIAKLLALEARLKAELGTLQRKKADMEQVLSSVNPSTGDAKTLRRENSDLKKNIAVLEAQVQRLLKARIEPVNNESLERKKETLSQTLTSILEQQGVIPVT